MEIDDLKSEVKRLSMRATTAKMNLHDLAEELPVDFEKIPEVAQAAFDAFQALASARKALKAAQKETA